MKKFFLMLMLGVVVISGYQLTEGVIDTAADNDYPIPTSEEKAL